VLVSITTKKSKQVNTCAIQANFFFCSDSIIALSIYEALAQPLQVHWPAGQGQEPSAPPQLHLVFLGSSETTFMLADSAVAPVDLSEFLAHPEQAQ